MLRHSIVLILVTASGLHAQSRALQVGASVGLIAQNAPTVSGESGFQVGLLAIRWLEPWLGLGSTLEVSRTSVGKRLSVCYFYDETQACFRRPETESVISAAGRLQLRVPSDHGIHLRGALGLACNRSLSAANPGERRTFLTPEFEAGVGWGDRPAGLLVIRVRNLDRWSGVSHGQGALLLGFLW